MIKDCASLVKEVPLALSTTDGTFSDIQAVLLDGVNYSEPG